MLDRYDAVVSLRTDSVPLSQKRFVLIEVFNKEKYQAIRAEVVTQLASDNVTDSRGIIRRALNDTAIEVRLAALNAYRFIPEDLEVPVTQRLKDSSYNTIILALDKLCESFPQNKAKYLDATKDEMGMSHKVHIKWLEIKAASTGDAAAIKELVDYTSVSYEFITRQTAMDALVRLNYIDNDLITNLIDALLSTNNRLAGSANGILTKYYGQTKDREMMMSYYKAKTWEPWQKEIVERIIK